MHVFAFLVSFFFTVHITQFWTVSWVSLCSIGWDYLLKQLEQMDLTESATKHTKQRQKHREREGWISGKRKRCGGRDTRRGGLGLACGQHVLSKARLFKVCCHAWWVPLCYCWLWRIDALHTCACMSMPPLYSWASTTGLYVLVLESFIMSVFFKVQLSCVSLDLSQFVGLNTSALTSLECMLNATVTEYLLACAQ